MRDHVLPPDKWEFNEEVAEVFDDMLQRSIPQYDAMRESTFELASKFVQTNDIIVDLGCSRGEALGRMVDRFGARCKYIGVDISEPMLKLARERFARLKSLVEIEHLDLRYGFPEYQAGVIQAILTLCFIPMEARQRVVANAYKWLREGGAFVVVEKILGETAELDELYVEQYLEMKRRHGYSEEEIIRKKLALEGILVPITANWLNMMLKGAGFRYVDCYWRWMNFGGWVAIK